MTARAAFLLLFAAVTFASAMPALSAARRAQADLLCRVLALAAACVAVFGGVASGAGLAWMATGLALLSGARSARAWVRVPYAVMLVIGALAAGFHALPGFTPMAWMSDFGRDGAQVLRWHFDKGFGGVLLVCLLAHGRREREVASASAWRVRAALLIAACTAVPLAAWALGIGHVEVRWLPGLPLWLAGNLFLTVVAEEAFFRGVVQGGLQRLFLRRFAEQGAYLLALSCASLLFGLAHFAWGTAFAALAVLAGVFYGLLYGRTHSLAWAVAGHFAVNAASIVLLRSPLG